MADDGHPKKPGRALLVCKSKLFGPRRTPQVQAKATDAKFAGQPRPSPPTPPPCPQRRASPSATVATEPGYYVQQNSQRLPLRIPRTPPVAPPPPPPPAKRCAAQQQGGGRKSIPREDFAKTIPACPPGAKQRSEAIPKQRQDSCEST